MRRKSVGVTCILGGLDDGKSDVCLEFFASALCAIASNTLCHVKHRDKNTILRSPLILLRTCYVIGRQGGSLNCDLAHFDSHDLPSTAVIQDHGSSRI